MKERDDREMLRADDRLPAGRRVLGREDLIEVDAGPGDPDGLVLPGNTGIEMAEKLLSVQWANPQGSAQAGAEDVEVAFEPLEGVEPGPLLLGDPMLEAQQEVLVDTSRAGRKVAASTVVVSKRAPCSR
jgi:hypothetical protein